jgi:hypothetical protein
MKLGDIAHCRSGDKGDVANLCVIARDSENYPLLAELVTADALKHFFGERVKGAIVRYELPQIGALNFVMHNALSGGVTRSLALDAHGKCLSGLALQLVLDPAKDS